MNDGIAVLGLLEDEDIVLDAAALQLAGLDRPEVDLAPYKDLLESMAERIAAGAAMRGVEAQAEWLAQVIGQEYGFLGDRTTYDDPANADMIRVIDRRRGLPVSLSILYVAAARRIGWAAEALNTPGHVLVRIGTEVASVIVDPFNGGGAVEPAQLASLLAAGPAAASPRDQLAPMPNRAVLFRLLLNQATRAEMAGDVARAVTLYRRMTLIAPGNGQGWWDRARLELIQGDIGAARTSLSAMLEMTRDPERRAHVAAALEALAGRPADG